MAGQSVTVNEFTGDGERLIWDIAFIESLRRDLNSAAGFITNSD